MNDAERRRVAVLCTRGRRVALEPLLSAYAAHHRVEEHAIGDRATPSERELVDLAGSVDAILLVGDRRRAPRTVAPGPVLDSAGRSVPVGWVPDVGADGVATFARAAASVHARADGCVSSRTVAVLAARLHRYDHLAGRIHHLLTESDPNAAELWTAGELVMEDMLDGLALGPAVACYIGHGRPVGWAGYRGVRSHHLAGSPHPVAAILSLTCLTASRRRTGISFAEQVVVQGSAAACLGAVSPTDHQWNARWAYRLCREIDGATTVGELIAAVRPDGGSTPYRLIGDPLAPLVDARDGRATLRRHTERCRFVPTPEGRAGSGVPTTAAGASPAGTPAAHRITEHTPDQEHVRC